MSRGGYGGGRGGAGARGKLKIAGVDCEWDIKGLVVKTTPAEKFPKQPPPRQPPPTDDEKILCQRYRALRDRIHDGPLYTVLGDGIKAGEKRKADGPPPTAEALFDPFTGTETYSAKYRKVRRRMPKLDTRPYGDGILEPAAKKQKVLQISKATAMTKLERLQVEIENQEAQRQEDERAEEEAAEEAEDEDEEDKPDAVEEDDNWSAVSSDSEDADDDYNAEQYFDNGEDDYGIEDGGHDDNYYE
ncbi:hypothetical protein K469DRAFT_696378 [Zopfia rhizophila CBS 207.26]|uniref:DNA-directed RNA polymerase III subunit n=1 Tax=Zopfia rhizophila CBS 207.26 TaxID=1314779 RepID=A0A6A6DEA9_9PEZI|nr:hypothetical protein K469DRAFT_696378 [Zopfia rhizophila CBS 207.26]